ncbi:MAG: MFS transporter [Clostridiales bacterium]|nr:MFS transporter [Clostridiales bacterium]
MCDAGRCFFGIGLIATGLMAQLWQLYFFYGVLSGLGVGMIYPRMMAYVVQIFPERRGAASGLATAAYGSGAILWAPTATALIERRGLSAMFCILGALFLVLVLLCAVFLQDPPADFYVPDGKAEAEAASGGDLNRRQMVRTGRFYLMVVIFVCGLVAGVLIISQASPILQQTLSFSALRAAVFVSIFSTCNMVGRFVWGSLSDRIGLTGTMKAVFLCSILSMVLLALSGQSMIVPAAMGLAAACYGGMASVLTPLTAQSFGSKYVTENYGVMYVVFGIASLIAPSLATACLSVSGSYTGAYLAAGILAVVGLVLTNRVKFLSVE